MTKIIIFLLLCFFSFNKLFASEKCTLDYSIVYLIAMNERHPKKPIGYPYIISINSKKEKKIARILIPERFFIDARSIDCTSISLCVDIASKLIKNNVTNLDLGAFQINYNSFRLKNLSTYFSKQKSYEKCCCILQNYVNKKNITFEDIANYHSHTRKYNKIYSRNLKINYQKLKKTHQ